MSFLLDTTYEQFFLTGSAWLIFTAIWLYSFSFKIENKFYHRVCYTTLFLAFICVTASLVIRGVGLGHVPIRNLYESLIILAWGMLGSYLVLEWKYDFRKFGVIVPMVIMGIFLYATWLPPYQKEWSPLIPALQSYWRAIHVPPLLVSYALFLIAAISAIVYLVKYYQNNTQLLCGASGLEIAGAATKSKEELLDKLNFYEEITYRCITFALPLLTFGIICGGLWANHAWGAIWQWDPKETLALFTWFIYAAYIHLHMRGTSPIKTSWVAVIGLIAVYITYMGINQFNLGGLHSYGNLET